MAPIDARRRRHTMRHACMLVVMLVPCLQAASARTAPDPATPSRQQSRDDGQGNGDHREPPAEEADREPKSHPFIGGAEDGHDQKPGEESGPSDWRKIVDNLQGVLNSLGENFRIAATSPVLGGALPVLLVYVGWRQARISGRQAEIMATQAELTRSQIELARAEFTAAHPPLVILRELVMEPGWVVSYTLANIGGSTATLQGSWIFAEYPDYRRPIRHPRTYGRNDLKHMTLAPGEIRDLHYTLGSELGYYLNFPDAGRLDPNTEFCQPDNLHFAGAILFVDNRGALRRMAFRRQWNSVRQVFVKTADPEHEYAE